MLREGCTQRVMTYVHYLLMRSTLLKFQWCSVDKSNLQNVIEL